MCWRYLSFGAEPQSQEDNESDLPMPVSVMYYHKWLIRITLDLRVAAVNSPVNGLVWLRELVQKWWMVVLVCFVAVSWVANEAQKPEGIQSVFVMGWVRTLKFRRLGKILRP